MAERNLHIIASKEVFGLEPGTWVPSLHHLDHLPAEKEMSGPVLRPAACVIEGVVMFIDMGDFTRVSNSVPLDDLWILVQGFYSGVNISMERVHGTVDKFIGDSMMLVFSSDLGCNKPIASAFEVAQDMLGQGLPLQPHIGMAGGDLLLARAGTMRKVTTSILGPPVNLAARLESSARDNEIVMPVSTWKNIEPRIDWANTSLDAREEVLDLKGFGPTKAARIELSRAE